MEKILKRNEVDVNKTWDLTYMFENDSKWEEEYEKISKDIDEIEKFEDNMLDNSENLLKTLNLYEKLDKRLGTLYIYAHLSHDTDTTNAKYQSFYGKILNLYSIFSSKSTFIEIKLGSIDEKQKKEFLDNENLKQYLFYINNLIEDNKYKLSQKEEELLAKLSPNLSVASKTYSALNNADILFDDVVDKDGKTFPLNHSRYYSYIENEDRVLRESAYNSLYKSYKNLKNTFASTLEGNTLNHVSNAKLRGYKSARNAALSSNYIDEKVYDALLETVNEKLPLLHRYVKLRKKILKIDELKVYDMAVPLVKNIKLEFTFEEAKNIILEALKPLGDEYISFLEKAFDERWIDYAENEGKRSGAYSSGTYTTKPYILISWRGTFDNLFTLAHELGHSLHSYYTRNTQPFIYGHYTIFLAEVASITNELLLSNYLSEKYKDNKEVLTYILNHHLDRIKSTLYRQTQFAEFENEIHKSVENGITLTSNFLSELYFDINKKYYGTELTYDDNIQYEWTRIPHFYYNFYVYQYATGMAAASEFSKKILTEGKEAVEKYIGFLKSGCSDYSLEILKKAGVDMSSPKPIISCLETFEKALDEIEKLI